MGNNNSREDRALSPLSSWGSQFEVFKNADYHDIPTGHIDRSRNIDHPGISQSRKESLELRHLEEDRRTHSADSWSDGNTKNTSTEKATKKKKESKNVVSKPDIEIAETRHTEGTRPINIPDPQPYLPTELSPDKGPIPGMLPRRNKRTTGGTNILEQRKPWSAPTVKPMTPEMNEAKHLPTLTQSKSLPKLVVLPVRTDPVRVGKPLNPPANPAKYLSVVNMELRRSRSVHKNEAMMKPAKPRRTQSDSGDASGISSTSISSTSSTRVVGTKKKRGKTPPEKFKVCACPDNILRPKTDYSGQPKTVNTISTKRSL